MTKLSASEKLAARVSKASSNYLPAKRDSSLNMAGLVSAVSGMVKAHRDQESADNSAVSTISVVAFLCADKLVRAHKRADGAITADNAWSDVFTITVKTYAHGGGTVYTGTEHIAEQIAATRDAKSRTDKVNAYLKGTKGEKREMVKALVKVRSYAKKVFNDLIDNAYDSVASIVGMESGEARDEAWNLLLQQRYSHLLLDKDNNQVIDEFGVAIYAPVRLAYLVEFFRKPTEEKPELTLSERIAATVEGFKDGEHADLIAAAIGKVTDVSALDNLANTLLERLEEVRAMADALANAQTEEGDESEEVDESEFDIAEAA